MHPSAINAPRASLTQAWSQARRLLVIRLDNIGDIVLLSPALRALKHNLPEARITLMASPAGSQVAPMLPWVDETIVLRSIWQDASGEMPLDPAREMGLVEFLRGQEFDAAIIFTSFSQSPYPAAYICYLAGIPLRLGTSKEFGGSLLTDWVAPSPDDGHQAERNLSLLSMAGFQIQGRNLELNIPEIANTRAITLLEELGLGKEQPYVLLAPGASAPARRYDPERFAEATRIINDQLELPVLIVGSQREAVHIKPLLELAAKGNRSIKSLVGQTDVPELAALVRRSLLVIANNSASLHFADAFRRPVVVMYSGTETESNFEPYASPARLLRRHTACTPCRNFRCPYGMECLDIPAKELVDEVASLLAKGSLFTEKSWEPSTSGTN